MDLPRISSFVLYYLGVAAILDFDIIFDTEYRNTLSQRLNDQHFVDGILENIFTEENIELWL